MHELLSVVAIAFATVGCTGKSQVDDPHRCPAGEPQVGSTCEVEALKCTYGSECGGAVVCTSGSWSKATDGCGDATAPTCPSSAPRADEPCPGPASCPYACGDGGTLTATCSGGSWKLVASGCALP
jgi:hypothetical protein